MRRVLVPPGRDLPYVLPGLPLTPSRGPRPDSAGMLDCVRYGGVDVTDADVGLPSPSASCAATTRPIQELSPVHSVRVSPG